MKPAFHPLLLLALALAAVFLPATARAFDTDYKESINGTRLHFRVRGADAKNPYLLILHGGPGLSAHMFYPWGATLEKSVNVVYLDQRGCGESERLKFASPLMPTAAETKGYTIKTLLADIEGVRRFLRVRKWYVLGHSWGGMLGLEYVTAYPDAAAGFIDVDGLLSEPMAQEAIITFADKQVRTDLKSTDAGAKARGMRLQTFLPYAHKLAPGKERFFSAMQFALALFGEMYYADAKIGVAANAKMANVLKEYNLPLTAITPANEPPLALLATEHFATRDDTPLLAKVRCKTLVVGGEQDRLIPPATARIVQKGIPGATLLLLPHCGHFPFAEQPAAFTKAVLGFVTSPGSQPAPKLPRGAVQ